MIKVSGRPRAGLVLRLQLASWLARWGQQVQVRLGQLICSWVAQMPRVLLRDLGIC